MSKISYWTEKLIEIASSEEHLTARQKDKIRDFCNGTFAELSVSASISKEFAHYVKNADFDVRNFLTSPECYHMKKQLMCQMGWELQNYCGHEYKETQYEFINTKTIWILK